MAVISPEGEELVPQAQYRKLMYKLVGPKSFKCVFSIPRLST